MKFNTNMFPFVSIFLVLALAMPAAVLSWDDIYYDDFDDAYYDNFDDAYYDNYDDAYYDNYDDVFYQAPEPVAPAEEPEAAAPPADDWTYDYFDDISDPQDFPWSDYPDPLPTPAPPTPAVPGPTPGPEPGPGPSDEEAGLSIQITGTRMQDELSPGDQLLLKIYVRNNGNEKLENMKIVLVNQELALRDSMGPMDLRKGERTSKTLLLDFPQGIEPGYYYLRINVHADGVDRVVYRDVRVSQIGV